MRSYLFKEDLCYSRYKKKIKVVEKATEVIKTYEVLYKYRH